MKAFVDQMNNTIRLDKVPSRIVSLVPSQTELLHDLGLDEKVVGITKFCIHPNKWYKGKTRVGGTKTVDFKKVKALNPDLIIGNKEENQKENISELKELAPIWMSDIFDLEDSLKMISNIGELCNVEKNAAFLIEEIKAEFKLLDSFVKQQEQPVKTVNYYIWNNPDMVAGRNTFIDEMLKRCGFTNLQTEERYPIAKETENPDLIFLSSEPYPFKEKHIENYQRQFPNAKIFLVDGEYFSWYGSRLKNAPKYFISLLEQIHQKT